MNFKETYPDMLTSVMRCAVTNQTTHLQELINNKCSVMAKDNQGWTALHHSCFRGYVECTQILLQADGIQVDALSFEDETPLKVLFSDCKEVRKPFFQIAELLLKSGADPNCSLLKELPLFPAWSLPLTSALNAGLYEEVKLLVQYGADVGRVDSNHGLPVHIAAKQGELDMLRYLLHHEASLTQLGDHEFTVLHTMAMERNVDNDEGCISCLKFILEHPEGSGLVNKGCSDGATPLMLACQTRWISGANVLMDRAADVNIMDCEGVFAVCMAVQFLEPSDKEDHRLFLRILAATNADALLSRTYTWRRGHPVSLAVFHRKFKFLSHLMDIVPVEKYVVDLHEVIVQPFHFKDEFMCGDDDMGLFVHSMEQLGMNKANLIALLLLCHPLDEEVMKIVLQLIKKGVPVNENESTEYPPLVALILQQSSALLGESGKCLFKAFFQHGAIPLGRSAVQNPFPLAVYVALHLNAVAFFRMCQYGCPVDAVLGYFEELVSHCYLSEYVTGFSSFHCRYISYLHVLDVFLPSLPEHLNIAEQYLSPAHLKNICRTFWESLRKPKRLLHLTVLAIRKAVFLKNGLRNFTTGVERLVSETTLPQSLVSFLLMEHIVPPLPVTSLEAADLEKFTVNIKPIEMQIK